MDYIDFQIVNNKVLCKYVDNGSVILLSDTDTRLIFSFLSRNSYKYNELIHNGIKTVRYYGITQSLINEIKKNNINIRKKVKRKNKYAGATVAIGGMLSLCLVLNSIGVFKNNDKKLVTTTEDVETHDYFSYQFDNDEKEDELDKNIIVPDSIFEFAYEDRSNSDKGILSRELYTDVVTRNANMYGLPSNLMLAVATQESGIHSTEVSAGGGFGLFQIQVKNGWNWVGKSITAYNFDLGQMETIVVCQKEDGSIDVNMLADLEYNTKVACMIMAYDLSYCNNDIIAALQTYNSGTGVIFLKKEYGEDWINHRENLPGDPEYIEHVLSYIPEDDSLLHYKSVDGSEYVVDVNNVYDNSLNKAR